MEEINLFTEAKPRYYQLIPKMEDGLVILSLFQKFGKSEFTEDQITEVINSVFVELGSSGAREEIHRNNNVILRLREFFLWRDRRRKVYGFKNYGLDFCERIAGRLKESYHPAKIERLFKYLLDNLKSCVAKDELELLIWKEDHFDIRSNELALQVEILDQQVSESVKEFRHQIKQPKDNIFELINIISEGLDQIKQHAYELTVGFQLTYDIDDIMQDMLKNQPHAHLLNPINEVLSYNQNVRNHLDQVSTRIDKIKPRIREFIFEFNQRELDRKTDLFLHYLLDESSNTRSENYQKRVMFPPEVEPFVSIISESSPRFYIVPERNFAQKVSLPIEQRVVNKDLAELALSRNLEKIALRKKVDEYVAKGITIINESGKLEFSPFFFQLLENENGNLNVAVKTGQRLVKQCQNRQHYQILIDKIESRNHLYQNIALWNMTIVKRT